MRGASDMVHERAVTQLHPTVCNPTNCRARIYWSGLPFPPPGDIPNSGIKLAFPASPCAWQMSASQRRSFYVLQVQSYLETSNSTFSGKLHQPIHPKSESETEVAQSPQKWKWEWSRMTLCDPMDCSLSGFSVHGIFQARVLKWIAISFSKGSSRPRNRTLVSRIAGRRFTVWATREAQKSNFFIFQNFLHHSRFSAFP